MTLTDLEELRHSVESRYHDFLFRESDLTCKARLNVSRRTIKVQCLRYDEGSRCRWPLGEPFSMTFEGAASFGPDALECMRVHADLCRNLNKLI
jgi:hypothetical protein